MDLLFFIKSIALDEEKRIVIMVQDIVKEHLSNNEYRLKVKEILKQLLKDDFKKLEVSSASVRITVSEGKETECKTIIEDELKKMMEMAAQFMGNMNIS